MSAHSYSRCWIPLIWGTLNREKLLNKTAATRMSRYLAEYAEKEGIYIKINFVNADHVHALIDLPSSLSLERVTQLLKGSSSHWINSNNLVTGKIRVGPRLWRVLSVAIECISSSAIHYGSRRASSRAYVRRRTEGVH
jgi:REP element-mobilizing transposase RayT